MTGLDIATIVGTVAAGGTVIGVAVAVVAVVAWRHPRPPKATAEPHEQLRVEVSNHIPVFGRGFASQDLGDHLVAVIARNGTVRPVNATGWGIRLPGDRNLVVRTPTTNWEPRLPCWVAAGGQAAFYVRADELRRTAAELGCAFEDMIAYVDFADGRSVTADQGVPLA